MLWPCSCVRRARGCGVYIYIHEFVPGLARLELHGSLATLSCVVEGCGGPLMLGLCRGVFSGVCVSVCVCACVCVCVCV